MPDSQIDITPDRFTPTHAGCEICRRNPTPWGQLCHCSFHRVVLGRLGPFVAAAQPALRSKLEGLHGESLLITGPWQVVAAHIRKAVFKAELARLHAADGWLEKAPPIRVGLTSDVQLHAQEMKERAARERRQEEPTAWLYEEDDDEEGDPEPCGSSTEFRLSVIRVGRMTRRDELAAGLAATAYLRRLATYQRPTWVVSERPYDPRNPGYSEVLAKKLAWCRHVELTGADL